MLKTKTIAAGIITILALSGIVALIPGTAEAPYECYFWKISDKIDGVKDSGKDLIICNYPGTTDMYHSYFSVKELEQDIVVTGGGSYTYSGKHPSKLSYDNWSKTKDIKP